MTFLSRCCSTEICLLRCVLSSTHWHTHTHSSYNDVRCRSIQSTARFRLFIYLSHIRARLVENMLHVQIRLRTLFLQESTRVGGVAAAAYFFLHFCFVSNTLEPAHVYPLLDGFEARGFHANTTQCSSQVLCANPFHCCYSRGRQREWKNPLVNALVLMLTKRL